MGTTALDPLVQKLQQVYARGWLVTVDETTRVKPLAIPVKAALLSQSSERTVGALTHKRLFSLQVLHGAGAKEVEKCRRVTDLVEFLTYPLSSGNRWLPEAAKRPLETALEARNADGRAALKTALGADDVPKFVEKRSQRIREDLDAMYKQLGQGTSVPEDKFKAVLSEVQRRLKAGLSDRITPRSVYNRIAPPDLTATAPQENWAQPLSLLLRAARLQREFLTDPFLARRLSDVSLREEEFLDAMDIFGDNILKEPTIRRAKDESAELTKIEASDVNPKEKCAALWKLISGEGAQKP